MFCVYGVSNELIHRRAVKRLEMFKISDRAPNGKVFQRGPTQDEYEAELERLKAELWTKTKPAKISHEFGSPEYAKEYPALSKEAGAKKLSVMLRVAKRNKSGGLALNKRTQKPTMQWVIYDPNETYEPADTESLNFAA